MVLMGWAIRQGWPPLVAGTILFFVGFFAWGHWAAFYALVADIVPEDVRGACYGLTNSINFIGSLIAPSLTGWVKDLTASFEWGCYLAALFICIGAGFLFSVGPAFRLGPEERLSLE
jgi:MFS family permease